MENAVNVVMPLITAYGLKVIGAIAILIFGRIAAGFARKITREVLTKGNADSAIISFTGSLVYFAVITFAVLASLAKFGVETTSFVAILGAAGFAIGFALQGSLSNFAAGILVLVLRPFRVCDFIDAAGVAGTVKEIRLFTTVLSTPDNIQILVPNAKIYGDVIKNFSANPTRRIDLVVGIGYGDSMKKAHGILKEIIDQDDRVLADPAPTIAVAELGDSSVNFVVRPWVKKEDYWAVKLDVTERIKEEFDRSGIEIPFPQRTVHLFPAEATQQS